jgi:hypothetical protein
MATLVLGVDSCCRAITTPYTIGFLVAAVESTPQKIS